MEIKKSIKLEPRETEILVEAIYDYLNYLKWMEENGYKQEDNWERKNTLLCFLDKIQEIASMPG